MCFARVVAVVLLIQNENALHFIICLPLRVSFVARAVWVYIFFYENLRPWLVQKICCHICLAIFRHPNVIALIFICPHDQIFQLTKFNTPARFSREKTFNGIFVARRVFVQYHLDINCLFILLIESRTNALSAYLYGDG